MFPRLLERLEGSSAATVVAASVLLVLLIALLDVAVGWRFELLALYAVPIAAAAWRLGWPAGSGVAALGATAAVAAGLLAGFPLDGPLQPALRGVLFLVLFVTVALLAHALRHTRSSRQQLSVLDPLTSISTSDAFYEEAGRLVKMAVRYKRPVTLAYIGVDNFAALNERFGHQKGDEVLISIAQTLRQNLRDTDIVARLAGDEFGVCFPETSAESARRATANLRETLVEATDGWPIGFSIGAVSCERTACTLDAMLQRAEALMRAVKLAGRNDLRVEVMESETLREGAHE
ncbi:MAG: GGDEF domain-containing protein [Gemmatimonadota bacterium]